MPATPATLATPATPGTSGRPAGPGTPAAARETGEPKRPEGGGGAALLDPRVLARKWRRHGTRELWRRGLRKLGAGIASAAGGGGGGAAGGAAASASGSPHLTDERTVAQLRALSYLLVHLDPAAAARDAVQRRRRRSDRDIFARFPLYLVPTYPGDARLFADPGFAAWLPSDLPLCRRTLEEIMETVE